MSYLQWVDFGTLEEIPFSPGETYSLSREQSFFQEGCLCFGSWHPSSLPIDRQYACQVWEDGYGYGLGFVRNNPNSTFVQYVCAVEEDNS